MDVFSHYKRTTLSEVDGGSCVLTSIEGQIFLAVSVTFDSKPGVVLFSPKTFNEPMFGETSILTHSIIEFAPIWLIKDAKIVASSDHKNVHYGNRPPAGALMAQDDGFSLVAMFQPNQLRRFDVATGKEQRSSLSSMLWFSSWSILAPDTSGELVTVCTVTT